MNEEIDPATADDSVMALVYSLFALTKTLQESGHLDIKHYERNLDGAYSALMRTGQEHAGALSEMYRSWLMGFLEAGSDKASPP